MTASPVHAFETSAEWMWEEPKRGEHFRRCSYCGSVHPEDFATIARGRVEWADQKYGWPHKFYVHVPNRDPERLFVVGSSLAPHDGEPGWASMSSLTAEQEAVLQREGYGPGSRYRPAGSVWFGTRPEHLGKVYTTHLADPELSEEVRTQAATLCGLRFEFVEGGFIRWEPAPLLPGQQRPGGPILSAQQP